MWYTIIFYLLLFIISNSKARKVLFWCGVVAALYYGLRYDYMPDYMAYYREFERIASPNYYYDSDSEHFEYGWIVLNKLFSPFGFFFFVFVCSCVFSYGVHKVAGVHDFSSKYLPIVIVGYFSNPTTAVLSSAQRQFLVTGIFLISYVLLLYNNYGGISKLWSKKFIIYYLIIFLCSTFHTSALILLFVPLLEVIPYKSKVLIPLLTVLIASFLYLGPKYLPPLLMDYIVSSGNFSNLENTLDMSTSGDLTIMATMIYIVQISMFIIALRLEKVTKDEKVALIMAIICILLNVTSYYMQEVYRMAMYIQIFVYLSLAIVCRRFAKPYNWIAFVISWVWILWNAAKVFQPTRSIEVYKTIFSTLF